MIIINHHFHHHYDKNLRHNSQAESLSNQKSVEKPDCDSWLHTHLYMVMLLMMMVVVMVMMMMMRQLRILFLLPHSANWIQWYSWWLLGNYCKKVIDHHKNTSIFSRSTPRMSWRSCTWTLNTLHAFDCIAPSTYWKSKISKLGPRGAPSPQTSSHHDNHKQHLITWTSALCRQLGRFQKCSASWDALCTCSWLMTIIFLMMLMMVFEENHVDRV